MKLNRTREEWAKYEAVAKGGPADQALADLAALFAEVDRLTAQLAEARAKADDWQAMKDERDAAKNGYANLLDDTNGEIKGLRAQLAAREGVALDLACAMKALRDLDEDTDPFEAAKVHMWCEAALARFHAAEGMG